LPWASGMLTGKYPRGAAPAAGTRFDNWKHLGTTLLTAQNFDRVDRLKAYAAGHQHTVAELAIAWLLAKRYIPSVIAGATKPAQLESNVRAADWRLTAAEVSEVERLASA
jgi:aryl-alcohol dehydrogenase-like predicted oxidoreductase